MRMTTKRRRHPAESKIKTGRGERDTKFQHTVGLPYMHLEKMMVFTWRSQLAAHLGKGFLNKQAHTPTHLPNNYFNQAWFTVLRMPLFLNLQGRNNSLG